MLALGFEADLAVCAELDATGVVPLMQGNRITLDSPATTWGGGRSLMHGLAASPDNPTNAAPPRGLLPQQWVQVEGLAPGPGRQPRLYSGMDCMIM